MEEGIRTLLPAARTLTRKHTDKGYLELQIPEAGLQMFLSAHAFAKDLCLCEICSTSQSS